MSNYSRSVPDTAARPLDWLGQAACRTDRDLHFDTRREYDARYMCVVHCPVRAACLAHVTNREQGLSEHARDDGIVAGLNRRQRWRLDPTAPGKDDEQPPLEPPRCGTAAALELHLVHGQEVDDECWSGEQRRHRRKHSRPKREPAPKPVEAPPSPGPKPVTALPSLRAEAKPVRVRGRTPKERHVYRLWSRGLSDQEIARRADLSTLAVRRIRDALGLLPNLHVRKAS